MEPDFDAIYDSLTTEDDDNLRQYKISSFCRRYDENQLVNFLKYLIEKSKSGSDIPKIQEIISDFCSSLPDDLSVICRGNLSEPMEQAIFLGYWKRRIQVLDRLLDFQLGLENRKFIYDFSISFIEAYNILDYRDEFSSLLRTYYKLAELDVDDVVNELEKIKKKHGKNKEIDKFINKIKSSLRIVGLENISGLEIRQRYFKKLASSKKNIDDNILLLGDSGVGKTTLSNVIHNNSTEHQKFLKQYFCDEGEVEWKKLLKDLQTSNSGGTVFLDEIHKLDMDVQEQLVTIFERRDIRVISATSWSFKKLELKMYPDFWRRVKRLPFEIPPLQERKLDLNCFLKSCPNQLHTMEIDEDVITTLMSYSWPGNYTEIVDFFNDICQELRSNDVQSISLDALREYGPEFSIASREILKEVMSAKGIVPSER